LTSAAAGEANAKLTIGKPRSSAETIAAKYLGWRECVTASSFKLMGLWYRLSRRDALQIELRFFKRRRETKKPASTALRVLAQT